MHRAILVMMLFALSYSRAKGAEMNEGTAKAAEAKRVRWASATPDSPNVYRVVRMKDNSKIDADWNKAAWKNVVPVSLEYYMGDEPEHQPKAQAKAAYDDHGLYIIWKVEDNYLLAKRTQHQQDVWRDTCAEFFFTPVSDPAEQSYFNLETNCIGVKLFGSHVVNGKNERLKPEEFTQIVTASSLTEPINPERQSPTTWTLEYKIPFDLIAKYTKIDRPAPGVKWRGNFYKCGDETSHPHWLTWSPVHNDKPSFHLPQYFGSLIFE